MPSRPPIHRAPWLRTKEQALAEMRKRTDAKRAASSQRGYDSEWRRFRRAFLDTFPHCSFKGCTADAVDVDHVMDVRRYPALRLTMSNCRGYCHAHHSARTAKDQGFGRTKKTARTRTPGAVPTSRLG